jgi:hypothetical protein
MTWDDLDLEQPGLGTTWTWNNLDLEQPGPGTTWTWNNLDLEQPGPGTTWHKKERMQTDLNLEPGCNVFTWPAGIE